MAKGQLLAGPWTKLGCVGKVSMDVPGVEGEGDGPEAQTWDSSSTTSMFKCKTLQVLPGLLGGYKSVFVSTSIEHMLFDSG